VVEGGSTSIWLSIFFNTFNVLYRVFGIRLERRPNHLPEQSNVVAIHLESDVVEDSEVGEHEQFVANFSCNALLGLSRGFTLILGNTQRCECEQTENENIRPMLPSCRGQLAARPAVGAPVTCLY